MLGQSSFVRVAAVTRRYAAVYFACSQFLDKLDTPRYPSSVSVGDDYKP